MLGLSFLAVGRFLTGMSYLWDLAPAHRSPRNGKQPSLPPRLLQPDAFSQLLYALGRALPSPLLFLPLPLAKGRQRNKPFPARMAKPRRPWAPGLALPLPHCNG